MRVCADEAHVFFWEVPELLRRTALTGWVLLIDEQQAFLRLLVALFVSLTSLLAMVSIKPFERDEDDLLAVASQCAFAPLLHAQ